MTPDRFSGKVAVSVAKGARRPNTKSGQFIEANGEVPHLIKLRGPFPGEGIGRANHIMNHEVPPHRAQIQILVFVLRAPNKTPARRTWYIPCEWMYHGVLPLFFDTVPALEQPVRLSS